MQNLSLASAWDRHRLKSHQRYFWCFLVVQGALYFAMWQAHFNYFWDSQHFFQKTYQGVENQSKGAFAKDWFVARLVGGTICNAQTAIKAFLSFFLGGIFFWLIIGLILLFAADYVPPHPPFPPPSLPPPTKACHLWASGDLILASSGSVNKGLVFILSSYSSPPFITRVILPPPLTDAHIFVPPTQKTSPQMNYLSPFW